MEIGVLDPMGLPISQFGVFAWSKVWPMVLRIEDVEDRERTKQWLLASDKTPDEVVVEAWESEQADSASHWLSA